MNGGRAGAAACLPAGRRRGRGLVPTGLFLWALLAAPLGAQQVRGVVLDKVSHQPVKGAQVVLESGGGRTIDQAVSGKDGHFTMKIPDFGVYDVTVTALGYKPFKSHLFWADSSRQVSADVRLSPAPVALAGLKVTASAIERGLERVGFYRRKKMGFGYYVTPKEIEQKTVNRITDAFRGIPDVQVRRVSGTNGALFDITMHNADTQYLCGSGGLGCSVGGRLVANSNASMASGGGSSAKPVNTPKTCYPSIYLDGDLIRHGGNGIVQQQEAGTWTELVDPHSVAAIEVYPNPAGLPPFASGSDAPCGTVLIWTKTH